MKSEKKRSGVSIGGDTWREILLHGAAELGICLSALQIEQLTRHAQELSVWNRKTNLTAITAPKEMAVKHFIDSMAAAKRIAVDAKVLDIGAGGGFPGLPLKVVRPDLSVTLIDAARKKISFLNHVIRILGLSQIKGRHIRAEDLMKDDPVPRFEVVICRALTSLEHFLSLADPLLADNGLMIAWKTPVLKNEPPEWAELVASAGQVRGPSGRFYSLERFDYQLADADSRRTLVLMQGQLSAPGLHNASLAS